jgi:hypothetical protein
MTQGQRSAMIVFALAIAVVTALLLIPPPPSGSQEGYHPLFPELDTLEVGWLDLAHPDWGAPARLERVEGGWNMVAPREGRADSERVEALLTELSRLEVRDAVRSDSLVEFGLDSAQRLELSFGGEGIDRSELAIGRETIGTGTYLLYQGRVLPSAGLIGRAVPPSLDDLRDRSPWFHSATAAISLSVEGRDGAYWRAELGQEGWALDASTPSELEPSLAPRLLRELDGLAIVSFSPPQAPGDAPPVLELILRDRDGGVQRLVVQELRDDGPLARVATQAEPVTLEAGSLRSFVDLLGGSGD